MTIVTTVAQFTAAVKACLVGMVCSITLQGVIPGTLAVGHNQGAIIVDGTGSYYGSMSMYGSHDVTWSGGVVTADKDPTTGAIPYFFDTMIDSASNITIEHVRYTAAKNAHIMANGRAGTPATNISLRYLDMSKTQGDCIDIAGVQGFIVEYNACKIHVPGSPGLHPDGFAIWSSAGQPQTQHGIIRHNYVLGKDLQGVTGFNHTDQGMLGFTDITIEDNVIATDQPQCVALYSATASKVTGNTCITILGTVFQPKVLVVDDPGITSGNIVTNNTNGIKP